MLSRITTAIYTGIEGHITVVEISVAKGVPRFSIVGLPATGMLESRERVRSSIVNCGYDFPRGKITVNLIPANLRKTGSHLDLPIAVGLLVQTGAVNPLNAESIGILGELALDGRVNGVDGVLPMVIKLNQIGIKRIIVPADNSYEASLVDGAEIVPFSPLHDKTIPADCDALYLSGGYPELYAGELSENRSMRQDIKTQIERGLPCIAECGGFLYLHEQMESQEEEGVNGKRMASEELRCFQKMVGIIPAKAVNRRRKGHFGYIEVTLEKDCLLGEKGDSFRAHEFHYWESDMEQTDLHVRKPGNGSTWTEGFCTETLYAGFPHLYFYGSPKAGERFLAAAGRYQEKTDKKGNNFL